jgi:two-component system, response regulator, stage 0 sporulation protein F
MSNILIVEDDDNQRLLYREIFEAEGFEVVEAGDGRTAITCIQLDPPDAVILDIAMPGMDGLQTLQRIHDMNRKLPVVINSAYAAYRDRYISWLADAYVVKSSNPGELQRAVHAALDEARDRTGCP